MNIWQILDIAETKDKDEIKKAYRVKLTTVNPEDDPEGFMKLREAYEEAVRLSDVDEEVETSTEEELTGVQLLIDEIYKDFTKRIDIKYWEEIFESDYFMSLESSSDSFEKLMVYIMNNYTLPNKVFKLIVDTFDIEERRQELGEIFPDDFLSYIINNAKYEDSINYYMFDGDYSCADEYIAMYYALRRSIGARDYNSALDYINRLSAMPLKHPFLKLIEMQMNIIRTRDRYDVDSPVFEGDDLRELSNYREAVLAIETGLSEDLREDTVLLALKGDIEVYAGNYEAAENIFKHILEISPNNLPAMDSLADMDYRQGRYVASRDRYMDMLEINPYDGNSRSGMYRANMAIIEKGRKTLLENPDDHVTMQEMGWSFYQTLMFDEGIDILSRYEPTKEESFQYYNLKGRMYIEKKEYEKALECFNKWKESIEYIIKTDKEKSDNYDKKKRYPYVKSLIGDCYMNLGRYDEALEILREALESEYDEKIVTMEIICDLLYKMREYDECIGQCDDAIKMFPESHLIHLIKAKACFEQEYLRESLNECNRTIAIFPYALEAYVYKIKIYQMVEQYDDAEAVIEQYQALGTPSDTMKYYYALNKKYEKKLDEAVKLLEELRESYNPEETDFDEWPRALCSLADAYDDLDRNQESIDTYKEVLEISPDHVMVHGYLGYMYRKIGEYEKSIDEYNKQIEIRPYINAYYNRAISFKRIKKFEESILDFMKVVELEPNEAYAYNHLGELNYYLGRFEESIEWYDKGLELAYEDEMPFMLGMLRWKARAYACLCRYQESVDIMQKALDTYGDKDDPSIRYELALTYTRMDRFDLSRKILEEYIENGENSEDRVWYMSLLMELAGEEGNLEESKEIYKTALSLSEDNKKLHGLMGRIFSLNRCYEEARDAFERALYDEAEGSDNYICEYLEMVSICDGGLDESKKELVEKAMKITEKGERSKQLIKLARLYRAINEFDKAIECLEKAIGSILCAGCGYGGCEEGYFELGVTYQKLGDTAKAYEAYKKSIEVHGHCGIYDERLLECSVN